MQKAHKKRSSLKLKIQNGNRGNEMMARHIGNLAIDLQTSHVFSKVVFTTTLGLDPDDSSPVTITLYPAEKDFFSHTFADPIRVQKIQLSGNFNLFSRWAKPSRPTDHDYIPPRRIRNSAFEMNIDSVEVTGYYADKAPKGRKIVQKRRHGAVVAEVPGDVLPLEQRKAKETKPCAVHVRVFNHEAAFHLLANLMEIGVIRSTKDDQTMHNKTLITHHISQKVRTPVNGRQALRRERGNMRRNRQPGMYAARR